MISSIEETRRKPRVIVIGAYGLIGAVVARRLSADGCNVVGLGRSARAAHAVLPEISWIIRDLAELCEEAAWGDFLADTDFVVNCAGSLQQSANDDLDTVHVRAVRALAGACGHSGTALVQISAVGVRDDAETVFMRTKSTGDESVRRSGARYWIFRPGLILARSAYGGSVLLRMLAAVPLIQPLACPDARLQTVNVDDVAEAVARAVSSTLPDNITCDLVEDEAHSLREVVAGHRRWLGFAPARTVIVMPGWLLSAVATVADALGALGWRSPLRSTAIRVLQDDVVGDPQAWMAHGGDSLSAMNETFAKHPARHEDRYFARMALLMPIVFAALFIFWFLSGAIGLMRTHAASTVLVQAGWPAGLAVWAVVFWSVVDLAIAAALLVRRYAAWACWAMVGVSLFYLGAATVTAPGLWFDPLGPLVKVVPAIVLALVARVMLENR